MSFLKYVLVPASPESLESSRAFFTNVLGWQVHRDAVVTGTRDDGIAGCDSACGARIIVLNPPGYDIGMIGFIAFESPTVRVEPFSEREGYANPLFAVVTTANLPAISRMAEHSGVEIRRPLRIWKDAEGRQRAMMHIREPNGIVLELTELELSESITPFVGPVQRFTIPVEHVRMEPSLKLYQEMLHLRPIFDRVIAGGPVSDPWKVRLVPQQGSGIDVGALAILEYLEPPLLAPRFQRLEHGVYPVTLVFETRDLGSLVHRARQCEGALTGASGASTYPTGTARKTWCFEDGNGVLVCCVE